MTITELITKLEQLREKHGDLPIRVRTDDAWSILISEVVYLKIPIGIGENKEFMEWFSIQAL